MSTRGEHFPEPDGLTPQEQETSGDIIAMKEWLSMVEEVFTDTRRSEEEVNSALDELFSEPEPDSDDLEAWIAYRDRKLALLQVARSQNLRADLILEIERRFQSKLAPEENKT